MATYRIEYIPDIPMTDLNGEPVYRLIAVTPHGLPVFETDDAGQKVQRVAVQLTFMLGQLAAAKFAEKLEAIDAAILVDDTRKELMAQRAEAKARGHWELDGDAAKRLLAAIEEPRSKEQIESKLLAYDHAHIHNFVPFMRAMQGMRKLERAAVEKQEEAAADN